MRQSVATRHLPDGVVRDRFNEFLSSSSLSAEMRQRLSVDTARFTQAASYAAAEAAAAADIVDTESSSDDDAEDDDADAAAASPGSAGLSPPRPQAAPKVKTVSWPDPLPATLRRQRQRLAARQEMAGGVAISGEPALADAAAALSALQPEAAPKVKTVSWPDPLPATLRRQRMRQQQQQQQQGNHQL